MAVSRTESEDIDMVPTRMPWQSQSGCTDPANFNYVALGKNEGFSCQESGFRGLARLVGVAESGSSGQ